MRFDLTFRYGDDWKIDWECTDGDGDVINLTGATLEFKMAYGNTTTMTRTNGDGVAITSATGGQCQLVVTPAHQVSASITEGRTYKWQFKVTESGGAVTTQGYGNLTVAESL